MITIINQITGEVKLRLIFTIAVSCKIFVDLVLFWVCYTPIHHNVWLHYKGLLQLPHCSYTEQNFSRNSPGYLRRLGKMILLMAINNLHIYTTT